MYTIHEDYEDLGYKWLLKEKRNTKNQQDIEKNCFEQQFVHELEM